MSLVRVWENFKAASCVNGIDRWEVLIKRQPLHGSVGVYALLPAPWHKVQIVASNAYFFVGV